MLGPRGEGELQSCGALNLLEAWPRLPAEDLTLINEPPGIQWPGDAITPAKGWSKVISNRLTLLENMSAPMIYPDLLVHLETYPDALPDNAIEQAAALAFALGREATVVAPHARIPMKANGLASFALNLGELARSEEQRARDNADHLARRFTDVFSGLGGGATTRHPTCEQFEVGEVTARMARTHDITLLPYGRKGGGHLAVAEALLFSSGRPTLLFEAHESEVRMGLSRVLVAWDGGAPAARAVAAAMPILKAAEEVIVLSILNEKAGVSDDQAQDLVRHLFRHGIEARGESLDSAGATIGSVLEHVCERVAPDLLVMGAFGHSRARQFVLGGATRSVIEAPPVPVLLTH